MRNAFSSPTFRMVFSLAMLSSLQLALLPQSASAQNRWLPLGPDGGDARSFAADPRDHRHIFLGTANGTIYDSHDGGQDWTRLSRIGDRDDLVIDNIVVDPLTSDVIYVGAWGLGYAGGGFYSSKDRGRTWTSNAALEGHPILALTLAPSDPKVMVVGALDGVFRTLDGGSTWAPISPEKSTELHEVESIAIDPKDPRVIFAGTWHLPWKTTDGGEHWTNMKQGIIDDSDVFSIIVDPANPENLFLSACSGIYRSLDQGATFTKVQGIPSTARRTRVLMEDSTQTNVVFAGTTEGLWRTTDSGRTFERHGDPSWIVNDVSIDKEDSKRVLLATDRTGVLLSEDGGVTFTTSNRGFSSRTISAVLQDGSDGAELNIGVINDKAAGGVFRSQDGGLSWVQNSAGLDGADVLSLGRTSKGTLLAGTRHGLYRLENGRWQMSGLTFALPPEPAAEGTARPAYRSVRGGHGEAKQATKIPAAGAGPSRRAGAKKSSSHASSPKPEQLSTGVYGIAADDTNVVAATEEGLLLSTDDGHTWNRVRSANAKPWKKVAAEGSLIALADLKEVAVSTDKGSSFHAVAAPAELTLIAALVIDGDGRIWIGGREGVYLSEDSGATWQAPKNVFVRDVSGLYFDRTNRRVLLTSNQPGSFVLGIHLPEMTVRHWDPGWVLREARPVGDHLVGITRYDGMVLQPVAGGSREISAK